MSKAITATVADVGILVGRFQVPKLHEGHLDLIKRVAKVHKKIIVFLGLTPVKDSSKNALDFQARFQMLQSELKDFAPDALIFYIENCKDDLQWSIHLDKQIKTHLTASQTALLYGSRDSFINHYKGKFPTQELVPNVYVSGTEIRNEIKSSPTKNSYDYRCGVIWHSSNHVPAVIPIVDVAVLNEDGDKVLLIKRADEKEYRFIGGSTFPDNESFEIDAKKSIIDSIGAIEVGEMEYVTSMKIDDWKYRGEDDKIRTTLFVTKYIFGSLRINEEIVEARWFELKNLKKEQIVEEYRELFVKLMQYLDNRGE